MASLQNGLSINTISLINGQLQVISDQKNLVGQFDGIYYERLSGRLFVMERSQNTLQEVISSPTGQSWLGEVLRPGTSHPNKSRLRSSESSSFNPLKRLSDGIFSQNFNYRTHKFTFDTNSKLLYVLQSKWKGSLGFDDKILSQSISLYSLVGASFDWWGDLKVEQILQDTNSKLKLNRLSSVALREVKNNKLVGLSTSHGEPWNVALMYDNGFQIRLLVLASADKKSFSCLLHEYIGRRIETDTQTSKQNILAQSLYQPNKPSVHEGFPVTSAYVTLYNIQAVVHKQVSGRKVKICVENRLSKVPAASTYNPTNQNIYPVERAHTTTISTILKVTRINTSWTTTSNCSTLR